MIKPLAALVSGRELKPFFSPDPFDLLMIDVLAFNAKQLGYLPIPIAPVLLSQPDQRQAQAFIIAFWFGAILLRRSRHADRLASSPF